MLLNQDIPKQGKPPSLSPTAACGLSAQPPFCGLESLQPSLLRTLPQPRARAAHPKEQKKARHKLTHRHGNSPAPGPGTGTPFLVPLRHTACTPHSRPGSPSAPAPCPLPAPPQLRGSGGKRHFPAQSLLKCFLWLPLADAVYNMPLP